ncbi:hypothetical protein RT723_00365 [Psychrosphaera aquimarina]|uniref:DUF4149 domain-containing protein n=1 Tax=Psychrosphaera aquimarina TaxID=2044854 RepID=A0ABU3QVP1_9GAMM|nr:hypothetical protein [Psychrosphaera aquimarina]MDU0111493.1 hypothetical protein [Psychrosphaera aquimarina]
MKKVINQKVILTALIVGLFASVAFIFIQPLFGMLTLTSRHAAAYVKLGEYDASTALLLSWLVHMSVSVFYALLSTIIFNINRTWLVNITQVFALGWITTLTATPANEFVVKLITSLQFPDLSTLSALNTEIGPKLWLHIMFFGVVIAGVWLMNKNEISKSE